MLTNLDNQAPPKVVTPPPTPPRAKTPSVESEIAVTEHIEKELSAGTFYEEQPAEKPKPYIMTV